ncbi:hypothetical protein MMC10_001444 [Thelotrema lepadinum]|nr:hypothetical protein [Thelotrema lepadinum]
MTEAKDGTLHKESRVSLKPVIKEIVRTQFFGNPIKLLVDRIHVVPYRSEDEESQAYRLWLSDTHKTIQTVLKPEIHPYVTSRDICDGSIVLVTKYRLEKAKRLNGEGNVWYLVVEDMESIDSDGRESVPFTFEETRIETKASSSSGNAIFPGLRSSDDLSPTKSVQIPRDEGPLGQKRHLDELSTSPTPSKPPKARKLDQPEERNVKSVSFTRPRTAAGLSAAQSSGYPLLSRPRTQPSPQSKRSDSKTTPTKQDGQQRIQRPLSLVSLIKITGPPQSLTRNRIVDVLAVVAEVSPSIIARNHLTHLDLPPSRNLRIMDPSTSKKVQLTVFVDAEDFMPKVGTVALFRSVTTHEWDGGSLKAYPRDCKGKEWFLPWPWNVEGCDVKAMKHWWEARMLAGL